MKTGAENRKKTIWLGTLVASAFCGILYNVYNVFSGPDTPPPTVAPMSSTSALTSRNAAAANIATSSSTASTTNRTATGGSGAVPGVAAQKLASTSASLDPTLDQAAMLRTESLVYAGSGRNIFSATYTAPAPVLPRNVPPPRPVAAAPLGPPAPVGPPPPPPIPLKFFGTAQRGHGVKQVFLLSGEDVYLASPGDIVARRYKVGAISAFGVQVTDLVNNNTQNVPLVQQ